MSWVRTVGPCGWGKERRRDNGGGGLGLVVRASPDRVVSAALVGLVSAGWTHSWVVAVVRRVAQASVWPEAQPSLLRRTPGSRRFKSATPTGSLSTSRVPDTPLR